MTFAQEHYEPDGEEDDKWNQFLMRLIEQYRS